MTITYTTLAYAEDGSILDQAVFPTTTMARLCATVMGDAHADATVLVIARDDTGRVTEVHVRPPVRRANGRHTPGAR